MKRLKRALLCTTVFTIMMFVLSILYQLLQRVIEHFIDVPQVAGILALLIVMFVYFFITVKKE